jgi:hypothetical protein
MRYNSLPQSFKKGPSMTAPLPSTTATLHTCGGGVKHDDFIVHVLDLL